MEGCDSVVNWGGMVYIGVLGWVRSVGDPGVHVPSWDGSVAFVGVGVYCHRVCSAVLCDKLVLFVRMSRLGVLFRCQSFTLQVVAAFIY